MEALGIDLKYFLFQLVNFVVLFLILRKLLHKPLINLLDTRKAEIESGLSNAEKMKHALAEAEAKQDELIADARTKAKALVDETRAQAKELGQQLTDDAKKKADGVLAGARAELAEERERLRSELKQELAEMVVVATEKVLQQPLASAEKKQQVITLVKETK